MKADISIFLPACLLLILAACDQTAKELHDSGNVVSTQDVLESINPLPEAKEDIPGMNDATVPPGHVAKSLKEWIPEFHRVDALLYDYTANTNDALVWSGKVHPGVLEKFTKTLSKAELERLESCVTGSRNGNWGALCYAPHHGFVFYDENDQILGHLEICFMCQNYKYAPRTETQMEQGKGPLSGNWDLQGMKKIFEQMSFPVLDHPEKWKAFFEEQK